MDPILCRELNGMTLDRLAVYLDIPAADIRALYQELLDDTAFLGEINERITFARQYFRKGICRHESVDSVDWFAIQRITLYVLVRLFRPGVVLETGVFYGGTTMFILNALRRNAHGTLISIDLPGQLADEDMRHHLVGDSEMVPQGLDLGFLVHPDQMSRWEPIQGDSRLEIPKIDRTIDFYNHDSDHSYDFIKQEMALVWPKLSPKALIMADDLDWSNGFFSFCDEKRLYPLIITDNGKSGLLARTGIVKRDHPMRNRADVVGAG